jgi:aminopeptidase N
MAMADASGRDLTQFERWYSQAGTPIVQAETRYDETARTYTLRLIQSCPATPGQADKLPFHIPVAVGLLGKDGRDLPLTIAGQQQGTTAVLELVEADQTFVFTDVPEQPTPSILRDFSAPVVLKHGYSDAELVHLFSHDSDPVNRWEAGQRLAMGRLLKLTGTASANSGNRNGGVDGLDLDDVFVEAMRRMLLDDSLDPAFRELALLLPSETMIADQLDMVDPMAIHTARQFMRADIGARLRAELLAQYQANQTPGEYSPDAASIGKRSLKNLALSYLCAAPDEESIALAQRQFDEASNMTDRVAALSALMHARAPGAQDALQRFYDEFQGEALVVDKWFMLQATAPTTDLATVRELMGHPAFTLRNPNRARSLVAAFCTGNPVQFHAPDGSGHAFWAEQVIALDALNPQVASRLARAMDRWRRYSPALQEHMKKALQQVAGQTTLSNDVREVVGKALAN